VLVVAHGNSLRALVKHLEGMSDESITEVNIPTGMPLIYHLDAELRPIDRRYLGDPEAVARAMQAMEQQGRGGTD
jgi:2,3-bisphosphoglycerate-dependent phosphoglycerate mutase